MNLNTNRVLHVHYPNPQSTLACYNTFYDYFVFIYDTNITNFKSEAIKMREIHNAINQWLYSNSWHAGSLHVPGLREVSIQGIFGTWRPWVQYSTNRAIVPRCKCWQKIHKIESFYWFIWSSMWKSSVGKKVNIRLHCINTHNCFLSLQPQHKFSKHIYWSYPSELVIYIFLLHVYPLLHSCHCY